MIEIQASDTAGQGISGLVSFDYDSDRILVSARDLHKFLEIGTQYNKWFPRMCEYGFSEGTDFWTFLTESTGGRPGGDAVMTIEMAKEISMLQRNDRGKAVRQYFIQLEKDWNSPEKVMARALRIADRQIAELRKDNKVLTEKIEADAPKVEYYEDVLHSDGVLTTTQIAKDYGLSAVELNRILQQQKIQYKVGRQWVLYQEHAGKGYMRSVTVPFERKDGRKDAAVESRWTQEGRLFLHNVLTNLGYGVAVPGQIALQ